MVNIVVNQIKIINVQTMSQKSSLKSTVDRVEHDIYNEGNIFQLTTTKDNSRFACETQMESKQIRIANQRVQKDVSNCNLSG